MKRIELLVALLLVPFASAQSPEAQELPLEFRDASWFDDEVGSAIIYVDAATEPTAALPYSDESVRFFGTQAVPLTNDPRGTFALIVEFIPRTPGLTTFPPLQLTSGEQTWTTPPKQILVGETRSTPDMELTMAPAKTQVYAGEPLRLDFVWRHRFSFKQLRDFRLSPAFFNDQTVKTVIPRSQAPEGEQVGLPIGSRRAIARETSVADSAGNAWSEIAFSLFIKINEAGLYEIPDTRLLCSRLFREDASPNRYAAYFSNGLFERPTRGEQYEKLSATAKGSTITVLPLPEKGRLESFSGLFAPVSITAETGVKELEVGQLAELRIKVTSPVASELLTLPSLSRQPGLRHRFWVAEEMGENWEPDGRSFVARIRPLTTDVRYLPSLSFQVFDPKNGSYQTLSTKALPIAVKSRDGANYFSVSKIPGLQSKVATVPDGIWHNKRMNTMDNALNSLIGLFADGFWWIVLLGPILFVALLPWARERRRRSMDPDYLKRHAAYRQFRQSEMSAVELSRFIARCYGQAPEALTARDAAQLLRQSGIEEASIQHVEAALRSADSQTFGRQNPEKLDTDDLKTTAAKIYARLTRCALIAVAAATFFLTQTEAADWTQAESQFTEALALAETSTDSTAIESAFARAAESFEACAADEIQTGAAWYNAGNAWFKAGELGRTIAAYRQAQTYRPFDAELQANLNAARALRIDDFGTDPRAPGLPRRWLIAAASFACLLAWIVAISWIRYRNRWTISLLGLAGPIAIGLLALWAVDSLRADTEGVLIVNESFGRKGPGFAYNSAYAEPLHNGAELVIVEAREKWLRVRLPDESECWLPTETIRALSK